MSGSSALVGATGLVGSTLRAGTDYDLLVSSANSRALRGGRFGSVVFTAARAEKWRANADPTADAAHIDELIDLLGSFTAERLTLISTVDVFPAPVGVDERSEIDVAEQHAYGAGRYRLEQAAIAIHPSVVVVRLPALFGVGLKKNIVYDLLRGNGVERIDPASSFQYYDLARLTGDLDTAWRVGSPLLHLVTEPVTTAQVVAEAFGDAPLPPRPAAVPVHYDVRTRFAPDFGGEGVYIEPGGTVLTRMQRFVQAERSR